MLSLRVFLISFLASTSILQVHAQSAGDTSENIVIQRLVKSIRYKKGDTKNPVIVKTEESYTYTCTKYRTEVPVVQMYNDNEVIDEIEMEVDGKRWYSSSKVSCEYFSRDGIFFSDEHVCDWKLPVSKIGSKSEATFRKTTNDPRYFTGVFFSASYAIRDIQVKIYVPDWMKVDFKEFNTDKYQVKMSKSREGDETVYSYTGSALPAFRRESMAPGITHIAPHILVMNKQASPEGTTINYFNNLQDQYNWYASLMKQVENDKGAVKLKTEELVKGINTDEEKVKRIFLWVQDNIRYIAFEDGIAGFRPEKAQEVLRKKYGDCKGMANLLVVMLQSINLDARRSWIGTKDIAYDYGTPALSVDNHMICAWMNKGKPVFLDATEKYIGFGEVAERIQGRQTLIEDGEKYILASVPVAKPTQNTSIETRKLVLDGSDLKGHIVQVWKGESKEWLLSQLFSMKGEKQENALREFLSEGKSDFEISNLKVTDMNDYNSDLKVEYDVVWKNAVSAFDKDFYLTVDNREGLKGADIDVKERKFPLWQHFKINMILEAEVEIDGKKLTEVPEQLKVDQPKYSFAAAYSQDGNRLKYRNEITLHKAELQPSEFGQWNKDVKKLTDFYNQQIVLKAN